MNVMQDWVIVLFLFGFSSTSLILPPSFLENLKRRSKAGKVFNKMVREADHDHGSSGVTNALLLLLQERFRRLEKMKEQRQEKELLRMLSESRKWVPSPASTLCTVLYPPKPDCQLSLSLWPGSSPEKPVDSRGPPALILEKSWPADGPLVCTSKRAKMDGSGSDIDTSLRL